MGIVVLLCAIAISVIFVSVLYFVVTSDERINRMVDDSMHPERNFGTKKNRRFETDEMLKTLIDNVGKKIQLYEEVREHILHGGRAKGIVWEYSPYMTIEDVETLIEELSEIQIYLKNIYSEILTDNDLKSLDETLVDLFKCELSDYSIKNKKALEKNLEELSKKYIITKPFDSKKEALR